MTGIICGTGACVPAYVLDNHGIAKLVDTNDTWIQERTGIRQRHIAKTETTVSMAVKAAQRAMEQACLTAKELDLILVTTNSPDTVFPATACLVQQEIGAAGATCFDISAACSGFVLAYHTAMAYLAAGTCKTALVIGSECLSRLINWQDRGSCILFGDGAGAVVMKSAPGESYRSVTGSDGTKSGVLACKSPYDGQWSKECAGAYLLNMDGREVFKFAVRKVPEMISQVLHINGVSMEEIDFFLVHQANRRIIEAVIRHLGAEESKFPVNIERYGNTSSASIPILLDEMNREGRLKKGQKLVLAGFGAGLTWGASLLEW